MESTSELGEKLDTLIRLQAAALVRDFGSQKDKIAFLAQAGGLGPKAIAEVLGTSSNAVSVALYQMKKGAKESGKPK